MAPESEASLPHSPKELNRKVHPQLRLLHVAHLPYGKFSFYPITTCEPLGSLRSRMQNRQREQAIDRGNQRLMEKLSNIAVRGVRDIRALAAQRRKKKSKSLSSNAINRKKKMGGIAKANAVSHVLYHLMLGMHEASAAFLIPSTTLFSRQRKKYQAMAKRLANIKSSSSLSRKGMKKHAKKHKKFGTNLRQIKGSKKSSKRRTRKLTRTTQEESYTMNFDKYDYGNDNEQFNYLG